jgi:hypothetical protein
VRVWNETGGLQRFLVHDGVALDPRPYCAASGTAARFVTSAVDCDEVATFEPQASFYRTADYALALTPSGLVGVYPSIEAFELPLATLTNGVARVNTAIIAGYGADGQPKAFEVDLLRGTATATLDLAIDNDHASNLLFQSGRYDLRLGGRDVASGTVPALGSVEGASTRTVSLPIVVDLVRAGASVVDILTNGGRVQAGFDATVDVDTPFGLLPLAIDERGDVTVER